MGVSCDCGADEGSFTTAHPSGHAVTCATRREHNVVLVWRCTACGWSIPMPMPGFAGDGYYHYENGWRPCGPLLAYRPPGFVRAHPGAPREEIEEALARHAPAQATPADATLHPVPANPRPLDTTSTKGASSL